MVQVGGLVGALVGALLGGSQRVAFAPPPCLPLVMPSFDTVLEPNLVELRNALEQSNKEIATRFDFKGTSARIESSETG